MGYQLARAEAVAATERFLLQLDRPRLLGEQRPRITWYERTVDDVVVEVRSRRAVGVATVG
jgi:hypothetical protein